jgi:hypothetical protein
MVSGEAKAGAFVLEYPWTRSTLQLLTQELRSLLQFLHLCLCWCDWLHQDVALWSSFGNKVDTSTASLNSIGRKIFSVC